MLQLIVLLAISWLLIWLFEKGNLSVLGLTPTKERLKYFTILFIVSAILSATAFLLRMYFAKEEYIIAQSLTTKSILFETWYCINPLILGLNDVKGLTFLVNN